jgi:tripartite-type tricarboxylate transporter receptor subunit TctC
MLRSLRRTLGLLGLTALTVLVALHAPLAQAQDKTLRIVVPFGPGGGSDNFARILQPRLAELLKQTVVIENKPGAGGAIGAAFVAKAPADGATVLLSDASVVTINPALFPKLPYSASELVPVINLAQFPHLLVSAPGFAANNMTELLAMDKARPGKLSIASSGNGTSPHLTIELLNQVTGMKAVHVPFKGSGPAINDTVGGQVDMVFTGYATVAGLIKSGKLKVLAVTSPRRMNELPQVGTVAEAGFPGFESWIAQAVFAPQGTPPETVRRLNQAIATVLRQSEVREQLRAQALEPLDNTPEEFAAWVKKQSTQWARVIREGGIQPD